MTDIHPIKLHSFTLVLNGISELSHDLEDTLFGAGCDDALIFVRDHVVSLDFDREAPSLADALLSAIHAVESSGLNLLVARVEPDQLVTASEIAERTHRTRESVRLLATGQRGPGAFPAPISGTSRRTRLWRWTEVASWFASHDVTGLDEDAIPNAKTMAAINGALALRMNAAHLDADVASELQQLTQYDAA